jgi:hypothetical protein
VPAIYSSRAFRHYAQDQVHHADVMLRKHAEAGLGLCACGRIHPCEDNWHWRRMRAHYLPFTGDPRTWPGATSTGQARPAYD